MVRVKNVVLMLDYDMCKCKHSVKKCSLLTLHCTDGHVTSLVHIENKDANIVACIANPDCDSMGFLP